MTIRFPGDGVITRCLGIDPAVNSGLVLLESQDRKHTLKDHRMLAFPKLKSFNRLITSQNAFGAYLDQQKPHIAVIEGYAYGNKFSLATAVEFGTVYRLECMKRGIPIFVFSPLSLKKFVFGKSTAKKDHMIMAVFKQWGFEAETNDMADAYGLALAGLVNKGAVNCTGKQRDAVAAMTLLTCN